MIAGHESPYQFQIAEHFPIPGLYYHQEIFWQK